jgi:hypothetical protein
MMRHSFFLTVLALVAFPVWTSDRKNARVPCRLPVPAVTLRAVCEPVRVLIEVGFWLRTACVYQWLLRSESKGPEDLWANVIRTPVRTLGVCTAVGGVVGNVTGLLPCLEPD